MWMLDSPLTRPGLFVTGTDTGVGKTAVTCGIAAALRGQGVGRVGVCKPLASGCRKDREGLVSEDAEALAHFADCRLPLEVVCPVRYAAPLAPAVAAEESGVDVDFAAIGAALTRLDHASDVVLVEGVGGVCVPLDRAGRVSVLDLAAAMGYPVLIVARSTLGTLNHTAMTARLLRDAGLRIAGVVMNHYPVDAGRLSDDPSVQSNRRWLEKLTGAPVLAIVPACASDAVRPERGLLPPEFLDAFTQCHWPDVLAVAGGVGG